MRRFSDSSNESVHEASPEDLQNINAVQAYIRTLIETQDQDLKPLPKYGVWYPSSESNKTLFKESKKKDGIVIADILKLPEEHQHLQQDLSNAIARYNQRLVIRDIENYIEKLNSTKDEDLKPLPKDGWYPSKSDNHVIHKDRESKSKRKTVTESFRLPDNRQDVHQSLAEAIERYNGRIQERSNGGMLEMQIPAEPIPTTTVIADKPNTSPSPSAFQKFCNAVLSCFRR